MQVALNDYIDLKRQAIIKEINCVFIKQDIPDRLKQSMKYSLKAGGKRIRPILVMASNKAYNECKEKVINIAIALEMIHTYSLIHDDLPAMDDDDLRRGKLTNHRKFDEATAILAGDALLTYSFELIADDAHLTDIEKVRVISDLSKASGPKGMVAGQMLDTEAEDIKVDLEALERIHHLKTGALLEFAITSGAFIGGATEEELMHLKRFSYYLGLIFQVQDDLLDVFGDEEKIGKPVGSDLENEKSTYPKLLGIEGAEAKKLDYVKKAKESLRKANADESYLMDLTELISERDH